MRRVLDESAAEDGSVIGQTGRTFESVGRVRSSDRKLFSERPTRGEQCVSEQMRAGQANTLAEEPGD